MEKWRGRVAIVTGANGGMGFAFCQFLLNEGLTVIGADLNLSKLQNIEKSNGSLITFQCDLTEDGEVLNMFQQIEKEHGGVDICINSAGHSYNNNLLDGSPFEWRSMLNLNVVALSLCTKLSIESMRKRGVDDGHVIHISSNAGHVVSGGSLNFYSATKHAVRALTEGLRKELRGLKSHIRISSVSPGVTETEFANKLVGDEMANAFYRSTKCIQPNDVAQVVKMILEAPPYVEINDVIMRPTDDLWGQTKLNILGKNI